MRFARWFLTALSCLASLGVFADEAVVSRNVHLRETPSTSAQSLRLLEPPEEVEILDATRHEGFFHVETEDGLEGWVWANYVRPIPPPDTLLPAAAATNTTAATAFDADWEQPSPVTGTFTLNGKTCGPTGSGAKRDQETNRRKNRTDIPTTFHLLTWQAIKELPYPQGAPKNREKFTDEQTAMIAEHEGVAIQTVGYIVAIKPQKNNSESCNCGWKTEAATDWHIALVEHPGDGENTSIVIEPTPRIKKKHLRWTKTNLEPWLNHDLPVRISGWLLFDPSHTNHLNKYRSTLWEIHPITKIEVWNNDQDNWMDLDSLTQ